ncbi:MAG: glycosyltransferase family 4 protein [Bacteroidia bacterium]|nr:glycosyltransferase family 4 protein [Bacteroidia bacterium]
MKIIYCIAGTYRAGGMERVLAIKTNFLANAGHEVAIVTTDQRGRPPFFQLNHRIKCYDLNINYEINNRKPFFHKLVHYPRKQFNHKQKLTRLLLKLKADIVVSMFDNDVSFITDIRDGSKKVLEIHFSKFKRLQYNRKGLWRLADVWRTRQDEKWVTRFHKFVTLTQEDKEYWGNLPNIAVIPNPLTFDSGESSPLQSNKVIAVGRYTYQKGFDTLIEIWSHVCKHNQEWQLEIIGDGEMKTQLQRLISDLQLEKRVSLCPPTGNMAEKYTGASLLAMTSRYEGLPMILLEAQSFGLPIVSFLCKCGPKDVITDGVDGFLIPEGNKNLFAEKLLTLMEDEKLRQQMGLAAKKSSKRYAEEKIMAQWITLFESLIQ